MSGKVALPRRVHLRLRRLILVTLLCLAPAIVSGQEGPQNGGTWKSLTPAPTKRTEVAAAALGGKIYVVGGFSEPSLGNLKDLAITTAVEEYDPATDRWTTKASLPTGLHHAGIGVVGNFLYVIGGFSKSFFSVWHPVATVYRYDPAADAWTERAPMPTPRGALAVAVLDDKLVAIGGYDGTGNSAAVEQYDPATNSWSKRAALPTPRDHLAAVTVGRRIYAIGGRVNRDYSRNLAITEVYDAEKDRWSRAADLPTPRSGITAGVIDGTIYVLGGEAPEGTFRENEAYSPETDRWRSMAPLPTPRHGLGSAVIDRRLYVIAGGPKPGGSFSNVNELFLPPARASSQPTGSRASAAQVGTIMALLATFQDAGVLPPEGTPEANQLIKALIQFQAAFMKSEHPAVRQLLAEALTAHLGDAASAALAQFRSQGWTSRSLEAVVEYVGSRDRWDDPGLKDGFRAYNVGQSDFDLLSRTFHAARTQLAARGQDLHTVYAVRRRDMPGFLGHDER